MIKIKILILLCVVLCQCTVDSSFDSIQVTPVEPSLNERLQKQPGLISAGQFSCTGPAWANYTPTYTLSGGPITGGFNGIFGNPNGTGTITFNLPANYYYKVTFGIRLRSPGGGSFVGYGAPPSWTNYTAILEHGPASLYGGGNNNGGAELQNVVFQRKPKPTVPTLSISSSGDNKLNLSWTAAQHHCGYKIYRKKAGESSFSYRATVGASEIYWEDQNLEIVSYSYQIRSFGDIGESGQSNTVSATPSGWFNIPLPAYQQGIGNNAAISGTSLTLESPDLPTQPSSWTHTSTGHFVLTPGIRYRVKFTYDFDYLPANLTEGEAAANLEFNGTKILPEYPSLNVNHLELYSDHAVINTIAENYNSGTGMVYTAKPQNYPRVIAASYYEDVKHFFIHAASKYSVQKVRLKLTNLKFQQHTP